MSIHELTKQLEDAEFFDVGHLPLAAAYCRKLNLVDTINRLVQSDMQLQPGIAVQAMVLDVLSGRSPLYLMESFVEGVDTELLLGERMETSLFNDTNLGRSLDALAACGTGKILTEVGINAASQFSLDATTVSYDTTSTSVWGDYKDSEEDTLGPHITYGHSKDNQPQLKQFMTELLCVERGVPLFGRTLDGNQSDKKSNNEMLTRIGSLMKRHGLGPGTFIYVADSAMVTKDNLAVLGKNRFISRLPANFSACQRVIDEVVQADVWETLGNLNELTTSKTRPAAMYRTSEREITLNDKTYRAIVIHSDAHDKRRQKKLVKALEQSSRDLRDQLKQVTTLYYCEQDAKKAVTAVESMATALHHVNATITSVQARKRGRPPKDRPAHTETRYELTFQIEENKDAVERWQTSAGCFVLLTNVPSAGDDALDSAGILKAYKGQYGVESGFAFLKDPLIVNDLFLKTPARIDALGMVLILALLVYRLMERNMRLYLSQNEMTVLGWDEKPTAKPTTYMLFRLIRGIQVLCIDDQRLYLKPPNDRQMTFLEALGLDQSVYLDPRSKCKPVIPLQLRSKG
ncbi:MAG: IS1634 family transposase [Sphaerochaetaceae bacterium]|jgi:transposase|nr:IS1634 family transposase [Sphaerochaetaceae bacterium]